MKKLILRTSDNTRIAVNHLKTGHNSVIIIAPGWFMTKDCREFLKISEEFSKCFDVIAMDFRGHGKSSGFYTFTAKETLDLKTVVNYAKKQYEKIYLAGFSLGGSLCLIHSAIEQDVNKVIVVSAPRSFKEIENRMWKKEAWLPTLKKFELSRWCSIRPSLIPEEKIKPIDIIEKIQTPTLFIAGEKDPTVYPWHTESLYKKATCPKQYELFENCYHAEDLFLQNQERFISTCSQFLQSNFN